eukprot:m.240152 g.240152  ORF g.240152 m.240152 type:complete len:208 (-) comp10925_c0_seq5:246-869(-)
MEDHLIEAAQEGRAAEVARLLQDGANVNCRDFLDGETPLHWASVAGHESVAELLLAHGADVHSTNTTGYTSLHRAASKGRLGVVRLLIAHGAQVDCKTDWGSTALHLAADRGHASTAELLLAHGANINSNDQGGANPSHFAADFGDKSTLQLLIANGADIDAKNHVGIAKRVLLLCLCAHPVLISSSMDGHHFTLLLLVAVPVRFNC